MLFVLLAFIFASVVRSQCGNCVATFAQNGGCDLLGSGLSEEKIAENMSNLLPMDCLLAMEQCEDAARTFCAGDMSCTNCSATFVEKGGCEFGKLGLSQDEAYAKVMDILPVTCLVQMEDCGQQLGEACMENMGNMSCSECSAAFVEKGGCELRMSGLSEDEVGAKLWELLPMTCMMRMEDCGQQLMEACMENMENMSCSECSATFAEKGGCELGMSGLSEDEMGAKMWEMLPMTCMMQMGECGQHLWETCIDDMENMSCSECSATFVEKGGCELRMSGLSEDEIGAKMMEMLSMTCMMQMEDCGQHLWEACMENMENLSCSECSDTFVDKGGCELVTTGRAEDIGDHLWEILPLTCLLQMDDCGEHFMEGCGVSAEDCQTCVEEFAAKGGCLLLNEEEEVDHLIPDGCYACGTVATEYCKTKGGSKKPTKRRQATKKRKSGKASKPASRKRRTGKDNTKSKKPTKGRKTKSNKRSAGRKGRKSGSRDRKLRR